MDKRIHETVLRFRAGLNKTGIRNSRIILYGSYSAGTAQEYSDIDLIVISDHFEGMDLWDRQCILGDSTAGMFEPIEALGYTYAEYEAMGPGTFVGQEVKPKGIEIT
ncbi:MAG TPA: nucleotidyltransferase domain-containing protein [bacterium]|nr:nucleotidyltransferase domain-containing protein [bacterium]